MSVSPEELVAIRETLNSPGMAVIWRLTEPLIDLQDDSAQGERDAAFSARKAATAYGMRLMRQAIKTADRATPAAEDVPDDFPDAGRIGDDLQVAKPEDAT